MQRDRFWFGTTMIVVPVMLLLAAVSPGLKLTRSGLVQGHVTFHGQPLAGGTILFVPEDSPQASWAFAGIDSHGDYRIGQIWSRAGSASKVRYRICLIPDDRPAEPARVHGPSVQTAWSGIGSNVTFPNPAASSAFPAKVCNPNTTRFEVTLGSEPAQVDITF